MSCELLETAHGAGGTGWSLAGGHWSLVGGRGTGDEGDEGETDFSFVIASARAVVN